MGNLVEGHCYTVVLEKPMFNGRPVYATTCGNFAKHKIAVLQHPNFNGRPVRAFATCFEGQHLEDWHVVAVPQRVFFNGRWVYGFTCCPTGSGSYGGSGSPSGSVTESGSGSLVSGIASGSPSGSMSGIASGTSGSGVQSGVQSGTSGQSGSGTSTVQVPCCLQGIPTTLYATFQTGAGDQCNGVTIPMTYTPFGGLDIWYWCDGEFPNPAGGGCLCTGDGWKFNGGIVLACHGVNQFGQAVWTFNGPDSPTPDQIFSNPDCTNLTLTFPSVDMSGCVCSSTATVIVTT